MTHPSTLKGKFNYLKDNFDVSDKCYLCKQQVHQTSYQIHVNIQHNPKIKRFCSKECKERWIFNTHNLK